MKHDQRKLNLLLVFPIFVSQYALPIIHPSVLLSTWQPNSVPAISVPCCSSPFLSLQSTLPSTVRSLCARLLFLVVTSSKSVYSSPYLPPLLLVLQTTEINRSMSLRFSNKHLNFFLSPACLPYSICLPVGSILRPADVNSRPLSFHRSAVQLAFSCFGKAAACCSSPPTDKPPALKDLRHFQCSS